MVLGALGEVGQYIFCSSAGVYLKSDQMPHHEEDAGDPKSRHKVYITTVFSSSNSSPLRAQEPHRWQGALWMNTMTWSIALFACEGL